MRDSATTVEESNSGPQVERLSKEGRISPEEISELVKQCQAGDRSAFETLFTETSPWVKSVVSGILGDPALEDEIVQEIYLTVWSKIRVLKEPVTFLAWLKRIAVNRSLRCAEKQRSKRARTAPLQEESVRKTGAEGQDFNARLILLEALKELSPKERAVLVVRELQGASYQELAALFSVPVGTIRSRLSSAKKKALTYLSVVEKK